MQWHGVGLPANVARHHRHRTELAHGARIAEDHAVDQAPLDVGQRDMPEGLPAGGAQHDGGFFLFVALRFHERNQFARHERKGDEDGRQHDGRDGENHLDVVRLQPRPQPALQPEHQHVDQARHHRRHRERHVDQRDQHALAAEIELGDGPRRRHAEHQVGGYRDQRGNDGELDGRQRIRLDQRSDIGIEALAESLEEHRDQRQHQKQREEQNRHKDEGPLDQRMLGGGRMRRHGARRSARWRHRCDGRIECCRRC